MVVVVEVGVGVGVGKAGSEGGFGENTPFILAWDRAGSRVSAREACEWCIRFI